MRCGVINWSKFGGGGSKLLTGPNLFFKTLFVKKTLENWGFSTFFVIKKLRAQISMLLTGPSWLFGDPQLGPINNFDLDFGKWYFCFACFKIVLKYLFYSVF